MLKYALLAIVIGGLAGYSAGRLAVLPIIDTQIYASRYVRPQQHPEPVWMAMPEPAEETQQPCDAQQRQLDVYERSLVRQMRQTEEPCR